jgi:hypothetical protein
VEENSERMRIRDRLVISATTELLFTVLFVAVVARLAIDFFLSATKL